MDLGEGNATGEVGLIIIWSQVETPDLNLLIGLTKIVLQQTWNLHDLRKMGAGTQVDKAVKYRMIFREKT